VFASLSFVINTMASQVLIPASYLLVTTNTGKNRKAEFCLAVGTQKHRFGYVECKIPSMKIAGEKEG